MTWSGYFSKLALPLALSFAACRPMRAQTCHARAEDLRARISRLQWSRVDFSVQFPYDGVPEAAGEILPWGYLSTAAIDGTTVEVFENYPPPDSDLDQWLAVEADRHTILHPKVSGDDRVYIMATANTKVSFLRRVVRVFEPIAVIRLVVRPTTLEERAWRPAHERQRVFDEATRGPHDNRHYEALRAATLSAAAGCPEAVDLVNTPTLVGSQRLPLLPDIFERCGCAGDMETLSALYWWMTFDRSRAARWLPWDPTVADDLGQDATYEQLVRATAARERPPVR